MGPGFEGGWYGRTEPNCTGIAGVDSALYRQRPEALLTRE